MTNLKPTVVRDLNITCRSTNLLISAGIISLNELLMKTEQDVLAIKGMGMRGLKDIKEGLAERDLCLGYWASESEDGGVRHIDVAQHHEEEKENAYLFISGAVISKRAKDQIVEFFRRKKHENSEVLLVEMPAGARVEWVKAEQVFPDIEITETKGKDDE